MECVVKGCGFFGSVETGNMCSKCYKDFINTRTLSNKPISAADEKRLSVYEKAHEIGEKISELIEAVERNGGCELLDHCYALRIELSKITQRHFNFVEAVLRGEETLSSGNNVEVEMSEIAAGISKLMSLIDRIAHEKLASGMDGQDESWEKMEGSTIETKKKKNRCERCNKKVGLLGFRCRCGGIFCGLHRMPELHTCEVDYKEIDGSNPNPHLALIKADKLEYRI